ncbi:MAG: single-stranded DNA-binding protein [Chloroflexi bacterium]|nr:single-stranded DNA-binding protein [Chloroflexota bacterium]
MSEREPKRQSAERKKKAWDIAGVSNTLKAPGEELRDVALGRVHRFTIPEAEHNIAGEFHLYPERLLVRYRNPSMQLDLANVTTVKAQEKLVQIESRDQTSRSTFFLQPCGSFTLTAIGLSADNRAAVQEERRETPTASESSVPEDELSSVPTSTVEHTQEEPGHPEKPGRVVLTGRVGRAPQLRETPNKRLIARMPLAVHQGEKTVWHNVLFFDEKAKKAAEELTKGEIITVIGYKHTREVPTRTGMKQVEQIFAAAVKNQNAKRKS